MPATILIAMMIAQPATAPTIVGRWINPRQSVIINLAPCGNALCGIVEWASDKAKADARRGTRQLVGTSLLTDLREKKPGLWRGRLFVPDQNLRAAAQITPVGDNQLKVAGCALAGKLCKSQLWTRIDAAAVPPQPQMRSSDRKQNARLLPQMTTKPMA